MKHSFLNFQVDHMTLLLQPRLYNVAYVAFNVIFGVTPEKILYEKRKEWTPGNGEESLTFAVQVGEADKNDKAKNKTIFAVVQPSEPLSQPSHVREMLDSHMQAAHWQHVALRTPDLLAFHKYALERGVQFITPILKDDNDDLIQVFSGEWFYPGIRPSGMFFEFVQRKPSVESLEAIQEANRELWFRDKTFLGLYGEKEMEYQRGQVTPFLDFSLFEKIENEVKGLKIWQITPEIMLRCEDMMIDFTKKKNGK
jgi:hypothetical protein